MANKRIYLSDINDKDFFERIVGKKYIIFDKATIESEFKDNADNEEVKNYVANVEIGKALAKVLRDKKVHDVVYLTYTSLPINIMQSINANILPKLHKKVDMEYFIITDMVDAEDYNYQESKDLFSDIYIRE